MAPKNWAQGGGGKAPAPQKSLVEKAEDARGEPKKRQLSEEWNPQAKVKKMMTDNFKMLTNHQEWRRKINGMKLSRRC